MILVCKVCDAVDSKVSNGDCEGCNECHSVEQGFMYLTEFEFNTNLYVSEEQELYDDDNKFIDTVENWIGDNPQYIRKV